MGIKVITSVTKPMSELSFLLKTFLTTSSLGHFCVCMCVEDRQENDSSMRDHAVTHTITNTGAA